MIQRDEGACEEKEGEKKEPVLLICVWMGKRAWDGYMGLERVHWTAGMGGNFVVVDRCLAGDFLDSFLLFCLMTRGNSMTDMTLALSLMNSFCCTYHLLGREVDLERVNGERTRR